MPSMYCPAYTLYSAPWFLRDKPAGQAYSRSEDISAHKSMLFHISAGDYITTLATILRFFEETIHDESTTPEMRKLQLKTMKSVREDLLYLDKHYMLTPKGEV